ncbi:MAG TPA: cytochrome c [Anaerolineales bacterium]|nr:cytochrome c [Anaerolineales bacterium]
MKISRIWLIAFSIAAAFVVVYFSLVSFTANRPVVINQTAVPPLPPLDREKINRGEALYQQHCAQCHSVDLKGSPTWKVPLADGSYPPPPHDDTGHTWHHPDEELLNIIANGGDPAYNSKMPAFKDKLTEDEMIAILEFFKSKWSRKERDFQWWISVRPQ